MPLHTRSVQVHVASKLREAAEPDDAVEAAPHSSFWEG
jgi:hypothetical protein